MCLFIFDTLIEKINNMETLLVREGVLEVMKGLALDNTCENLEFYST